VPEKEMAHGRVLFSLRPQPDREWPSLVEARMWVKETVRSQVRLGVRQLPKRVWPMRAETRFSLAAGRILTTKRNLKMRRMMKTRRMSLRLQV
jgi:hypothetical protein